MSAAQAVALQYLVEFRNGHDYKAVEDPNGDVPVIGSGGPFARASACLYDGESVLFGRKGTIDRPRYENGRFWTVDTMYYTVLGPKVDGRWLYYWATTVPYELYSTSTALPSMTSSVLGQLMVPVRPLDEQRRIADFLDRETAEIDAMDAELDRLVETLQERELHQHQAAIDLGGHPAAGLAVIADVTLGKMLDQKKNVGAPTPYIRAANIAKDGTVSLDDVKTMPMTEDERTRLDLRSGDIVMIEGGDAGRVAHIANDIPDISFQKTVLRIRPRHHVVESRYLFLALRQAHRSGRIAIDHSVSTIPHFTAEKAGRLLVPLPSLEQQLQIVSVLDEQTARIDDMIADAQRLRALLAERRSTLITEVVTGVKPVPADAAGVREVA